MKTNNRFVLVDNVNKLYSIYEGKTCLAAYQKETGSELTKEEIEAARLADYLDKA